MLAIRNYFRDLPLRNKLIITFSLLILIPVMGISSFSYMKSKEIIQKKTSRYTIDVLNEVSKNIEFTLNNIDTFSYTFFTDDDILKDIRSANSGFTTELARMNTINELEDRLSSAVARRNDIVALSILTKSNCICNADLLFDPLPRSERVKDSIPVKKGMGSLVYLGVNPERGTIKLGRAINDLNTQKMIGYLFIDVRESSISELYRNIKLSVSRRPEIIDDNGRIVSSTDKARLFKKANKNYRQKIIGGGDRGAFVKKVGGIGYTITYHSISSVGWKLFSLIPNIEYEQEVISLRTWMIIAGVLCWSAALLISIRFSAMISKPIKQLSKMMKKIEKGDYGVRAEYSSKDEVGVLSEHFNMMAEEISYLIQEVYEQNIIKKDAELKTLRMQINPHFLYNTLESINWMARIKSAPEAGEMAKALGDLMRKSIGGEDFTSLKEEITNVENYLIIQKYRYGERLSVEYNIDYDLFNIRVPKLILQPLVENAIIHGIEPGVENGKILIEGFSEGDDIVIKISDNGVGIDKEDISKIYISDKKENSQNGIGISNVQKRIQLYYGERYGMYIESEKGRGTSISLRIPNKSSY